MSSSAAAMAAAIAPSVIQAGGGLSGSIIGGVSTAKNRRWQEYMSNTAHQREMEDFQRAGLNPMLAAGYGGESSPSGGSFSPGNPLGGMTENINTGLLNRQAINKSIKEVDVLDTQGNLNSALSTKAAAETDLTKEQVHQVDQAIKQMQSQTNVNNATAALQAVNAQNAIYDQAEKKATSDIYNSAAGGVVKILEKVVPGAADIIPLLRPRTHK